MQADAQWTVVAPEDRLTVVRVFLDADPVIKLIMLSLALAAGIAVAVWIVQATRLRRRRSSGFESAMAYLTALSAAGPMIGFFGGAYTAFGGFLGVSNVRPTPTLTVLAPGYAEALLVIMLGLLGASIAIIGRQHLKAKLYAVDVRAGDALDEPAALQRVRVTA